MTGVAALFVVLRLFAVARYDWHTAFSVADTIQLDDAPTIVIGTLMADRWVSGGVLVVLLRDEHDVVIVDTADVTFRTECEHHC